MSAPIVDVRELRKDFPKRKKAPEGARPWSRFLPGLGERRTTNDERRTEITGSSLVARRSSLTGA